MYVVSAKGLLTVERLFPQEAMQIDPMLENMPKGAILEVQYVYSVPSMELKLTF